MIRTVDVSSAVALTACAAAVASAVVAVLALGSARSSASAASLLATLEAARRHDERAPSFSAWLALEELHLRLDSDHHLATVDVVSLDSDFIFNLPGSIRVNSARFVSPERFQDVSRWIWRGDPLRGLDVGVFATSNDGEKWALCVPVHLKPPHR